MARLQGLPTVFAYEHFCKKDARVGRLTRVRSRQRRLRLEYTLDEHILPGISGESLAQASWELDISEWELSRTHWAIKSPDLYEALAEASLLTPEQLQHIAGTRTLASAPIKGLVVHPTAFAPPPTNIDPRLIAVMMPVANNFNDVYDAIRAACRTVEARCERVDDIWQESVIVQDVFNLLVRSRAVVVDFSGRNPNVMYETGIAHTLGRDVVPLCQSGDDIPFDLRHHRYLKYEQSLAGLANMTERLASRLRTLLERRLAAYD